MAQQRLVSPLWLNIYGVACLALLAVGIALALVGSPQDAAQGQLIRIVYAHVSVAWISFLAVGALGILAMIFLWRGGRTVDILALASAEMGLFYGALTIIGGMTYSKPTLGVWWTWDPKLTLTAIMVVLLVGYMVTRALIKDPMQRGRVSAVIGILAMVSLPLNWMATKMWRTAHPAKSFEITSQGIEDKTHITIRMVILYNVLVGAMILGYFMVRRVRLAQAKARYEAQSPHLRPTQPDSSPEVIHV